MTSHLFIVDLEMLAVINLCFVTFFNKDKSTLEAFAATDAWIQAFTLTCEKNISAILSCSLCVRA